MNITVKFDFSKNIGTFMLNGQVNTHNFRIVKINDFTKTASLTYNIGEGHNIVFSWTIWADREQFFEVMEYRRQTNFKIDPWTSLLKWSYIKNPQAGTVQTNNVNLMYNNYYNILGFNDVNFIIENCPYGDWSNIDLNILNLMDT